MATLYISHDPAVRGNNLVEPYYWCVQTFTIVNWFLLTSVKLDVYSPASCTWQVSIYATGEDGKPTGSALAISAEQVTDTGWHEFVMDVGVPMHPERMYAICAHNMTANNQYLSQDGYGGEYSGGMQWCGPTLTGLYQEPNGMGDVHFEAWGDFLELTPDFIASSTKIALGSPITFTHDTIGGIVPYSYVWDFGDTETSTEETPIHTYTKPGFYTVTLTVTDSDETEEAQIKVNYIWIQSNSVLNTVVTETDITPVTEDAWTDVLTDPYVDSEATGAMLHIINTAATEETWGVRENGDTGNTLTSKIAAGAHTWAMIGVDGSLRFEAFITSVDVKIFIYGYTMFGAEFITPVQKSISGGWTNVDCTAQVGALATGLIFIVKNDPIGVGSAQAYGIRINDGLDSFTIGSPGYVVIAPGQMHFVTVGCDTGQVCEFQTTNTADVKLYLIGYLFDGVTFLNSSISMTPEVLALYVDCDAHDISHTSGWVQVQVNCSNNDNKSAALRYPGDAADDYDIIQYGGWKWQRVNADHIFEGKIQSAATAFFVNGWCTEAAYNLVTINGLVMIGSTPAVDAWVFCFNKTRSVFVGHAHTDEYGQYTFVDAGYQFEEFLVSAHCLDSQLKRYGECKQITLLDI